MHPIVSEHLARTHQEDLRREAAAARRTRAARVRGARAPARPPAAQRVRVALGRRLVDAGTRLAGTGPGAAAGSGVPCP